MKAKATKSSDEPVGIVIAGMPAVPTVSVFHAYVWGPAPGTAEDDQKTS
jgi:hypothetical protein